mgnify:CR=1 FL=1
MNNELGLSKKLVKEFEDKMFTSKNMDEFKDFIVKYFRSHKGLKITMSKERLKELEKPEKLESWTMNDIVSMALLNSRLNRRVKEI